MKVPPKRKGNLLVTQRAEVNEGLNESPSQKEGKWCSLRRRAAGRLASMKVPPKRKGNGAVCAVVPLGVWPQ